MTPVVEKLGAAVDDWVTANHPQLVATRRHLHAHPELGYAEFETTSFLEQRLREAGLTEEEIARLSSPIGLDLGARTPEETAVSIAAEIIAGRWGGIGSRCRTTGFAPG